MEIVLQSQNGSAPFAVAEKAVLVEDHLVVFVFEELGECRPPVKARLASGLGEEKGDGFPVVHPLDQPVDVLFNANGLIAVFA